MNIHLILGTEQNCKVHIRASIYNKFKTYLFEKDKYRGIFQIFIPRY